MSSTAKTEITAPKKVRRKAGLRPGEAVAVKVSGRAIATIPKARTMQDEYTPAQRRRIDARLAKAEDEIRAGRVHGPFTAKEASAFVEQLARERAAKKTARSRR